MTAPPPGPLDVFVSAGFGKLAALHAACVYGGISWSVGYEESSDNWTFDIASAAPAERFHIKKTASLEGGVDRCLAHLAGLGYYRP